jgi:CMP-N-acetylneuraminic acid synthetase
MRTVALVPMRHNSERVPGKNYRPLGGKPLYHHVIHMLLSVEEVDDVVIDTDSDFIRDDAATHFPTVQVLDRPDHLRGGEIPMNAVLLNTIGQVDGQRFLQTHSTNPFLKASSVSAALRALDAAPEYDSVFSVTRFQARFWTSGGEPLNHNPNVLLRTQDLDPIYLENSCMYIFVRNVLTERHNRIGFAPLMFEIPVEEALDIDEESDFAAAERLWAIMRAVA